MTTGNAEARAQRRRLALAMALAAVWTLALALPAISAKATYSTRVTGDELQYLTTAISIAQDAPDAGDSDRPEHRDRGRRRALGER